VPVWSAWRIAAVAVLAWLAYELLRHEVVRWLRRRNEVRIDAFLRTHRIPHDPFRHTHRVVVKEQVLSDPGLVEVMAARAREEGVGVAAVQAKVRTWLDEIVPQFNLFAYYRVGYRIGRLAAYSAYHVRLDKASLARAQAAIPKDAAVVYVSNHRSNADFVVTGFMLSKSVQVSYAVGEWARVWPLEGLFKSFGSYFVRRGEKDPLYHRTLEAYIQLITKQGVTQAVFPEGGLSRNGALRPVKLGLLDNMAKAKLDPAFTKPLVFVPVGINFDRVLEDEVLAREARGEAGRPKRTLPQKTWRLVTLFGKALYGVPVNLGRFFAKRLKKHGVVAIHFGQPVVFDEWYDARGFLAEPDRHTRWEALRPFGEDLMARIGRAVPVTPATMTCLALRSLGRDRLTAGVDRGDLILSMRHTHDTLRAVGAPLATGDPYLHDERRQRLQREMRRQDLADVMAGVDEAEDLDAVLSRALDVLERRRILYRESGGGLYRSDRWDLVEYYANSLNAYATPTPPQG
jgi:glycerol-3-phosphate O-acyltransferase